MPLTATKKAQLKNSVQYCICCHTDTRHLASFLLDAWWSAFGVYGGFLFPQLPSPRVKDGLKPRFLFVLIDKVFTGDASSAFLLG
jgi:hypothetical protein